MCSYQVAFRLYTIVVEKNQNCSNRYLRMKGLLNSVETFYVIWIVLQQGVQGGYS